MVNMNSSAYLPGTQLADGEELECDESAYVMLHQAQSGSPCLSFDLINTPNFVSSEFPMQACIVAGTQAPRANTNHLMLIHMSNLHQTLREEGDESDTSDNSECIDDDPKSPKMTHCLIQHNGSINRVRCTNLNNSLVVAAWSELGKVNIYDLTTKFNVLNESTSDSAESENVLPIFSFNGHKREGFAVDWSNVMNGYLATGDCHRDVFIWRPANGSWAIDKSPLVGHTDSVEDIQWSPNETHVLATCSVDKSIRIWDIRAAAKGSMINTENAHDSDVNVINWNKNDPFILSGGDDGVLKVWDLRNFTTGSPIASFNHHKKHVTTVEWHPTDSTVFASGDDDHIALWDLSIENDDMTDVSNTELQGLPQQVLFIHQGQSEIKELHWYPHLSGVILSTANSGFNIFKTISV